jgi:hypothetical protein
MPTHEQIQKVSDALGLAILQHLKRMHQVASATVVLDMRHDVFQYIFKGKGKPSTRSRCILLERNYFSRCTFYKECEDWDMYVDHLGDGTRVVFPIRAKLFVSWGPKTHKLVDGKVVPKPRYHQEKLSLNFNKCSITIV